MSLKTLFLTAIMAVFSLTSCGNSAKQTADTAPEETPEQAPKAIVCYFSATGTTAEQAKRIADLTGADLFEILPAQPYTDADLDWRNKKSRSSVEMNDRSSRPEIANKVENIDDYSIVFIGYPNWWNTAPTIINTFIEATNLEGKTIIPFMTSGGSGIENSEADLHRDYPALTFAPGLLMNDVTDDEILTWANK